MSRNKNNIRCSTFTSEDHIGNLSPKERISFFLWTDHLESSLRRYPGSSPERFLEAFDSIPTTGENTYLPSMCFFFLLSKFDGPRPIDILRCYLEIWRTLPEAAKLSSDPNGVALAGTLRRQVQKSVGSLLSLLPTQQTLALTDIDGGKAITYHRLYTFIQNFCLPLDAAYSTNRKPVVVLALPNGYLLGLASLTVSTYYTAMPVNISGGAEQFQRDVMLTKVNAIMVLESEVVTLGLREPWVTAAGIDIFVVEEDLNSTFSVRRVGEPIRGSSLGKPEPNLGDDFAFILLTSGTNGVKKVVPISVFSLVIGTSCVIDSWGLKSEDTCINMMPLNHVGGIVRNLLAPVLSGGATVLCSAFDPNTFWDILEKGIGTWYYGSPAMHSGILTEASLRAAAIKRCRLRLVCNAAASLLPTLAQHLKEIFRCVVLPSYGMTECMPISAPPLDYNLKRPGTVGFACGPEIKILDHDAKPVGRNEIGRICVRGGPTFGGYLEDNGVLRKTLLPGGWFDTGDVGYFDANDYLFLTGRQKEVINRGGELISPLEIEEAISFASQDSNSPLYGLVNKVLAFSAPRDVLQEVVGVVLVTNFGKPRPDLRVLQEALKTSLHSSKWPVVLVYMDALPTRNGKLLRIKLGERLSLFPINDDTTLAQRHFHAVCPPPNTSLETKIQKSNCPLDADVLLSKIRGNLGAEFEAFVCVQQHTGLFELVVAPRTFSIGRLPQSLEEALYSVLRRDLDGYLIPSKITCLQTPFPMEDAETIDEQELTRMLTNNEPRPRTSTSGTELKIRQAIAEVLQFPVDEISPETDFFDIGGNSLSAGRLLSLLRRTLQIRVPVEQLFTTSKVRDLTKLSERLLAIQDGNPDEKWDKANSEIGSGKMHSSTNPIVLLLQLLPITLFYPLKMALRWTILIYVLVALRVIWNSPHVAFRYACLMLALAISRLSVEIASPIFGILFKWIVIGRYKEGLYPMWGPYHMRWWLVQKALMICNEGVFGYSDSTRVLYYRLLGAKIGRNVIISPKTVLGEYDLLDIGDNVLLDSCICRPFACERNSSMFLGRIIIGKNASIGLKSLVSPGSVLPDGTFIGPNSSSHEINPLDDSHGSINRQIPEDPILLLVLVTYLAKILVLFLSSIPWMVGYYSMATRKPSVMSDNVKNIITWWASPRRIAFRYLSLTLDNIVGPFFWFAALVGIRILLDRVIGKASPHSAEDRTQADIFRRYLMEMLVPRGDLKPITRLFGLHYEFTSMAIRALGGKVGKNIYWPGQGPEIQDFSLITVGNDVVFGSRSFVVTSDSLGSAPVEIQDRAMVGDRVILSPGSTIGKNTLLGSGTLAKRHRTYAADTVWLGNKDGGPVSLTKSSYESERWTLKDHYGTLEAPKIDSRSSISYSASQSTLGLIQGLETDPLLNESPETELLSTPFGRAFYYHKAPYFVFNQTTIFLYCTTLLILARVFWDNGPLLSIGVSMMNKHSGLLNPGPQRPFIIYGYAIAFSTVVIPLRCFISMFVTIAAKWVLLGRRKPGSYDWDKSSYCQRWQVLLTIETIINESLEGIGVLRMLSGTHYAVLYFRALGAKIGKDCALYAGGELSGIITEPDLLELGDRVAIDDASLVSHINSRGYFSLNRLSVGSRSVLRSGSRLLSGAEMGEDTCLLEHTLIMGGDTADDGKTYQGWPADVFKGNRMKLGI